MKEKDIEDKIKSTKPKTLETTDGVMKLRTMADLHRTLDRLGLRKKYHKALSEEGIDIRYIVQGIKKICEDESEKSSTRLTAYMGLLRSLGLDKYDKEEDAGKDWEDVILDRIESENINKKNIKGPESEIYEVTPPMIPEEEVEYRKKEKDIGKSLYEI